MSVFVSLHATSAQIAAFKNAGHDIVEAGVTAVDHAVAIVKSSPEAQKIVDAIHTMKDGTNADGSPMTGWQKLAAVVLNDALPIATQVLTTGPATIVTDLKAVASAVVTSLYADLSAGLVKASGDIAAPAAAS